jgi:hypothetical protein
MVLRRIFGPRRDEVTGEWRRLHNEELNDLYCSPSIVRVIKSRRIRWAGHVARMGEERGVYRLRFFSSKCSLFHNSNVFGSCIIHILFTGWAKI